MRGAARAVYLLPRCSRHDRFSVCPGRTAAQQPTSFRSHPPMRALPVPSDRPMDKGPAHFVDPVKGADRNEGTQQAPWKTIGHAVKQLKLGDSLYLRGGTYY